MKLPLPARALFASPPGLLDRSIGVGNTERIKFPAERANPIRFHAGLDPLRCHPLVGIDRDQQKRAKMVLLEFRALAIGRTWGIIGTPVVVAIGGRFDIVDAVDPIPFVDVSMPVAYCVHPVFLQKGLKIP